jgi:hypothetical protein
MSIRIIADVNQPSATIEIPLDITHSKPPALELVQLTGAICPGDDEVYRPGLWIVLSDPHAKTRTAMPAATQDRIHCIAGELVKRLQLL